MENLWKFAQVICVMCLSVFAVACTVYAVGSMVHEAFKVLGHG
jgi:hypothetical protein